MTGSVARNRVTGEHYWSEEVYRIFGLDQSVTPSFDVVLTLVHPDDLAQVLAAFEHIKCGENELSFEFRAIMLHDGVKHLRDLVTDLHSEDKGVSLFRVTMDITAANSAEKGRPQ